MTELAGPFDRVASPAMRDAVLPPDMFADLLAFTLAKEPAFKPARLLGNRVDPSYRVAMALPRADFAAWREILVPLFTPLISDLCAELGTASFEPTHIELELVRHNDGDFYRRHIDTATAKIEPTIAAGQRMLSMVYYYHTEPKRYEGGALRLLPIKPGPAFVDVLPGQNRLVAFPSWVPHEVMPISCPSGRFADSRFAINCWAWGIPSARPTAAPQS